MTTPVVASYSEHNKRNAKSVRRHRADEEWMRPLQQL